ncbi:uncharacterized protein LOC116246317 [Nymphaea colorata]|nr:uncharacterized protein LOC116246317 [Nymphaea colorata]
MEASADHTIDISEGGSQESGWTMYIDYFLRQQRGLKGSSSSQTGRYSTVSDAASAAAWQPLTPKACRRLNFKRSKTGEILDEDPLEDTASSSSPKVSGKKKTRIHANEEENHSAEQENNYSCNCFPLPAAQAWDGENECAELRSQARNNASRCADENKCKQLNERGLCLLPVSMVMNYIR